MEKLKTEIGKHYDRNQIFYDLFWMNKKNLGMHYGFWEEGTKNLHEAIINENKAVADVLEIKESDIILDAGCGVGGTAIWLAENYGTKVTGITLSQKQAKAAEGYAKKRKVDHLVSFYIKDFFNTGFADGSFTKILGIESVCYAGDKEDFLKESYRLLKSGGKLAVADFYINKPLNKRGEQLVADFCRGWEILNLPTLNEFEQHLEKVGFRNIKNIDKTKEIGPSSKRMFIVMGRFVRAILKFLEFSRFHTSRGGTKATVSQYYMFKEGVATYNIVFAQKP